MPRIPDVMYIVDPRKERIAVQEAHKLNIQSLQWLIQTVILMRSML